MGLTLDARPIDSPRQLPAALEALAHRTDALWGIPDQLVITPQTARYLLLFSFRNRIPFIGLSPAWVKAGALFSLEWDYRDIGLQCAGQALQILGGAPTEDVPVQAPRQVRYVLNRRTAEQMKISLPASLEKAAARVY